MKGHTPSRKKFSRAKHARVVAVGGGTGLSTVLRGLKRYVQLQGSGSARHPITDLAAIVTVTDDGGSSGRLRREYAMIPPGDIRNCLVALSDDETLMSRLFQYRFHSGRGLRGHSFGNLFLTALSHVTGDFADAVHLSGQVLAIRGRIYPSTTQNVSLEAVLEGGRVLKGETHIARARRRIKRLRLVPRRVQPLAEAMKAIEQASLIVIGPGSLYTSIIPNLLVHGVADAIARSRATRIYISNLMTQPGETDGLSIADHVRAIYRHTGRKLLDCVVLNQQEVSPGVARRYRTQGAEQLLPDRSELERLGLRCIYGNLLEEHGVVRHNSTRLAQLLVEQFVRRKPSR